MKVALQATQPSKCERRHDQIAKETRENDNIVKIQDGDDPDTDMKCNCSRNLDQECLIVKHHMAIGKTKKLSNELSMSRFRVRTSLKQEQHWDSSEI